MGPQRKLWNQVYGRKHTYTTHEHPQVQLIKTLHQAITATNSRFQHHLPPLQLSLRLNISIPHELRFPSCTRERDETSQVKTRQDNTRQRKKEKASPLHVSSHIPISVIPHPPIHIDSPILNAVIPNRHPLPLGMILR
jgi:hypothetical protein